MTRRLLTGREVGNYVADDAVQAGGNVLQRARELSGQIGLERSRRRRRGRLRLQPGSLYAKVHRAEALLFQQRRSEAEAELREVIASDPQSPHSRTARALLDAADLICATSNNSVSGVM